MIIKETDRCQCGEEKKPTAGFRTRETDSGFLFGMITFRHLLRQ